MCELLGLEPLNFANEGKLVIVVKPEAENAVLAALHQHPLGKMPPRLAVTEQKTSQLGLVRHIKVIRFTPQRAFTPFVN